METFHGILDIVHIRTYIQTMKDDYDFSNAKRGPVVKPPPGKTRITIRIDADVLAWFKEQVNRAGGGNYQTMVNKALREYVDSKREPLEEILRRVVREELQTAPLRDRSLGTEESGTMKSSSLLLPFDDSILLQVADTCRRWHIRRLALFGSAIRDDFGPDSDIDILVDFEPGHAPGFDFITIQDELTEIFDNEVDLHTPASLSKYFRDDVLESARDLYDAA